MKQQNQLNSHDSFEIQLPYQNRNYATYPNFYQKLINETINNKKKKIKQKKKKKKINATQYWILKQIINANFRHI